MVERTLDFLELFAEHRRPLSLSEISKLTSLPMSSCHDVLRSLAQRGYIYEITARAGYYPTFRLNELAKTIADNDPILFRAEMVLRELRDLTDETVLLSKADGKHAIYLLSIEPAHSLRFKVTVGSGVRNLYATSAGKAQLGSWTPADLDAYLETAELKPLTAKTVISKTALKAEIEASRRRGWYSNLEETSDGVVTLSAPFNWNAAIFIVTIAGPASRIEPNLETIAARLLEACAKLQRQAM